MNFEDTLHIFLMFLLLTLSMYLFVVMVVPNECLIKVEKDANIVATIGFNYILKKPSSYLNNYLTGVSIHTAFALFMQNHQQRHSHL